VKIGDFILKEKRRGDCYRLLSACFYQPQKEICVQEEFFNNLEGLLRPISPDIAAHVLEMENAFLKYSEEDLLVAYGKNMVMGDSTMEVIKLYEEHGLSMDSEFRNLPDHITVEMEFMYYLIFKETEALEKSQWDAALDYIKTQGLFFDGFLRKWVNPFCDKIKEGTDNEFYTNLADCVSAFIEKAHPGDDIPEELSAKAGPRRP